MLSFLVTVRQPQTSLNTGRNEVKLPHVIVLLLIALLNWPAPSIAQSWVSDQPCIASRIVITGEKLSLLSKFASDGIVLSPGLKNMIRNPSTEAVIIECRDLGSVGHFTRVGLIHRQGGYSPEPFPFSPWDFLAIEKWVSERH